MTRETRIGLLVGFVFIVAFGLVLSGMSEPPAAPAAGPSPGEDASALSWSPSSDTERPLQAAPADTAVAAGHEVLQPIEDGGEAELKLRPPAGPPLAAIVQTEVHRKPDRPSSTRAEKYVVVPGDNLTVIARKVYGREHGKEYRRIYEANKRVLPDASTVIVGQELVIPPLKQAQRGPAVAAGRRHYTQMSVDQLARHFKASPPAGRGERTYVVRSGDSLTKIAREKLGDDSRRAVRKLFNANRDKLNSPDHLPVGVTLRIPASS